MKKILIIGAGFLQAFVIQKAKELGYETLAVDANNNAIGFHYADKFAVIDIVDEKACLAYAKKENIDGVLTAATDYGVLTAAYIAKEMNLPGLDYNVAKRIKNKYEVSKCLADLGIGDTTKVYQADRSTNLDMLCKKISFPVMVKPCDGSGSRAVSRVDCAGAFVQACESAMNNSISESAEIEPFINGDEYGAECLVVNGEVHVLGIMQKWMTSPPYYAELGHAIPSDLCETTESKVIECVKEAVKALGINFGSVNIDMLITKEGKTHIVDIGARMGGNMIGPCIIPYGTGIDYIENMIRAAMGEQVDLTPESDKNAVVTRLLAFKEGIVKSLPDFEALEKEYGVEIYHHIAIGQKINEYHTNLDGCGYIIAKNKNKDIAIKNADKVLEVIRETVFR